MAQAARQLLTAIEAGDHGIMRRVHKWPAPRWIRLWMICATRGGDGWLWNALGLALCVLGGREGAIATGEALVATAGGIVVFRRLKRYAGRRRPCVLEPHCWATLLPPDQFSFPSGHTITAFAVTVPILLHYPDLTGGLMFCAASVAVSRVLLGMHFLSDVVAGAAIGTSLGLTVHRMFA
jgi:undecaprenyl-diphosphatase